MVWNGSSFTDQTLQVPCFSCKHQQSDCVSAGSSPTSSRKIVPLRHFEAPKTPLVAPVTRPFSWPNILTPIKSRGEPAAQFTLPRGVEERRGTLVELARPTSFLARPRASPVMQNAGFGSGSDLGYARNTVCRAANFPRSPRTAMPLYRVSFAQRNFFRSESLLSLLCRSSNIVACGHQRVTRFLVHLVAGSQRKRNQRYCPVFSAENRASYSCVCHVKNLL